MSEEEHHIDSGTLTVVVFAVTAASVAAYIVLVPMQALLFWRVLERIERWLRGTGYWLPLPILIGGTALLLALFGLPAAFAVDGEDPWLAIDLAVVGVVWFVWLIRTANRASRSEYSRNPEAPPQDAQLTIGQFYDLDPRRRETNIPFGEDWTLDSDPGYRYDVFWIEATGELFAMRAAPVPTVRILGKLSRERVDQVMDGWKEKVRKADSLHWVIDRVAKYGSTGEQYHGG
jgi:hypothetical protein